MEENKKSLPKRRVKDPDKSKYILGDLIKENKTYQGALQQDQSNFIFNKSQKIVEVILTPLSCPVVKGYLVASNFMHLNDEKKIIYWILLLTVAFLAMLLFIQVLLSII